MEPARASASTDNLGQYRQLVTMPDGLRLCLRPAVPADYEALIELFSSLPPEETEYFRSKVIDRDQIALWSQDPTFEHSFPLVAVVGDQLVGACTLFRGSGATRHLGEVRVFLAKQYRRRGIGSAMLKTQIEVARRLGLQQVHAEIAESQPQVIHAFEHLGFERHAVIRDQFITPNGDLLDLIQLVKILRQTGQDF